MPPATNPAALLFLLPTLLLLLPCAAEDVFVAPNGDDVSGEGSVDSPYRTMQRAIDACLNGDTIIAAAGIYRGIMNCNLGFRTKSSGLAKLLSIVSPVQGAGDLSSGAILDCRDFGRVFTLGLGQSIRATNLTLLGGFVSYGGIAWARDCAPVFTACTFLNSSSQLGGAVLCDGGCRATFVDCSFLSNRATRGGAIYAALASSVTVTNSIFKNNSAVDGGAVFSTGSSIVLQNCALLGCSAGRGGAWASDAGNSVIRNSLVKWNGAITGGSIFLSGDAALLLSDVLLLNNTAKRGGAVAVERASLLLMNYSTLVFNTASSGGAAVAAADQAVVSAFFTEISWNRDPIGGQVIGAATATAFSNSTVISVPLVSSADAPVYSRASAAAAAAQFEAAAAVVVAGNRPTAAATSKMTVCSNGGSWVGNNPSLLCTCDSRHVGVECEIECPAGGSQNLTCGGNGFCWTGSEPSTSCSQHTGGCNSLRDRVPQETVCRASGLGACVCNWGYVGRACTLLCPGIIGSSVVCSGHGSCVQANASAVCQCDFGWGGEKCNEMRLYVQAQANTSAAAVPVDDQRLVRLVDQIVLNQPNRGLHLLVMQRSDLTVIFDQVYDTELFIPGDAAISGPFFTGGGGVGFNGEAAAAVAQQPPQPQAVRTYYGQQPANLLAQALTLFDSRHLLIITSYDAWCAQMNEDVGLQLARHGAPNMSSYIPGGNCTQGKVFLLVAVGLSGVYKRPDLVWFKYAGAEASNTLLLLAASAVHIQELSLVWTSVATGAVITEEFPGAGSGIWTPVNRSTSRLEVWDLATDLNATRTMRWRHGSCMQNGRVVLPVDTSSISQQTLVCWNTLVGQAMDATQWTGSGQGNALPMTTKTLDARALLDKREMGHELV